MKSNVAVSEIMTKNILRLELTDDLSTAESLLKKNHIRHLPVVENGHIVGMVSLNDLLRISFADALGEEGDEVETSVYNMFTVDQVMTRKVVSISSQASIKEVADLFLSHEFHALPVVDGDSLVGIVTTTDLIRYFMESCGEE